MATKRAVGRPRHFGSEVERKLILDAAYNTLRDQGRNFTIANILAAAGVSTRSFYRHFESKDALLCAMYRRDSEWAHERLTKRLADQATPSDAVVAWIDEVYGFRRSPARAERVAVLGSIHPHGAEGIEVEIADARRRLVTPLISAVRLGVESGDFDASDPDATANLIAAAALAGAGVGDAGIHGRVAQAVTTEFCLRSLRPEHGS